MAWPSAAAAPQLAATGLGVAICPVTAISAGFPGAVRSFSPQWVRKLAALTPAKPDPLTARFISDLQSRGVHVPGDVRDQLTNPEAPARKKATRSATLRVPKKQLQGQCHSSNRVDPTRPISGQA
jgi:hypothetical protein